MTTIDQLPKAGGSSFRFDRAELAGAVGDLGVLVPIAVALIVKNGLTPTAVLLPAGLLYVVAGLVYRLPVPVQPLKAFGAIAIAHGFGADEIAAGALLMGAIFLTLGMSGLLDWVAKVFPQPIIRGIQLSVGLLFCQLAWKLVSTTPKAFTDHRHSVWWLAGVTVVVISLALLLRRRQITLVFLAIAIVAMVLAFHGSLRFGPSAVHAPHLSWAAFSAAAVALVLPQFPLSFANSCLATADTARAYFGDAAQRVRPGRLATTIGLANLFAGTISGMPVCHGAGGMTAHRSFGARSGGAPIMLGSVLITLALAIGAMLTAALAGFPVPILAGLLTVAGLLHITLLKDLRGLWHWALALAVGITGFLTNLAVALVGALVIWWAVRWIQRWRAHS
ncbi:putative sulfate/molybdate transporter [Mycobacterium sp.]|uniref:putative sulfate/molybdate transporter n=1 Tax=Mycobacterium sp. TaxID=1785 RepID=UPI003C71D2BB